MISIALLCDRHMVDLPAGQIDVMDCNRRGVMAEDSQCRSRGVGGAPRLKSGVRSEVDHQIGSARKRLEPGVQHSDAT
jgi:hypothetical protein